MSPSASLLSTLLVSCPDRPGLVAALAQVLYGHGANILDSDQHVDSVAGLFFQRIRYDRSELRTDAASLTRAIEEVAERFEMDWRLCDSDRRLRTAVFVSKVDHCLYDLLLRHRAGELDTSIACVIGNHPELSSVADQFGVPFHHFPIRPENKREQEEAELTVLADAGVDLIVLARYMQIVTADFIERFAGSIINIHHSFLPAFSGGSPYQQAHRRGVKLIGATAHYVTEVLDEGPIIAQDVVRCSHRDSVPDLMRKGRDLEKTVLATAVRAHLEHRVLTYGNKTVVFD